LQPFDQLLMKRGRSPRVTFVHPRG